MSMMLRRHMMIPKSGGGGLPAEYQQVAYLESSGTQCIDTGIVPDSDTEILLTKGQTSGSLYNYMFGANHSATTQIGISAGNFCFYAAGETVSSMPQNPPCKIEIKNKILYIDGAQILDWSNRTGASSVSMAIFCRKNNSGTIERFISMKLYAFKMWAGGSLVRDFVPCVRISDSEPGLYDLASGNFFTNAGSGEFIIPT